MLIEDEGKAQVMRSSLLRFPCRRSLNCLFLCDSVLLNRRQNGECVGAHTAAVKAAKLAPSLGESEYIESRCTTAALDTDKQST